MTTDSAPRTKPKPRPSTRPASTSRKNIGSSPAVPALSTRSAPPMAASTPSTATVLASSPPAATSARVTRASSADQQREQPGRVVAVGQPDLGAGEERPAERDEPDEGDQGQREHRRPAGAQPGRPAARSAAWRRPGSAAHDAGSSAAATSATVSHGSGCRILATCGANAGEPASTSRDRPVGDHLAVGQHDDPVGDLGGQLHVVGGEHDGVPARRRGRAGSARAAPWRGSPGRGSARRAAPGRRAGQHDGQGQGEPLALGQVPRVLVARSTGPAIRSSRPARRAGRRRRSPRSAPRHSAADRVGVQQVARVLRHQPDPADQLGRRQVRRATPAGDVHPARGGAHRARQGRRAGWTCRRRCGPSARSRSPAARSRSTPAERGHRAAPHDQVLHRARSRVRCRRAARDGR